MSLNRSLWLATSSAMGLPSLAKDVNVDIAIIGGGIAGVICGYQLTEQGFKVAILESLEIAGGVTGYTTAKVTSGHRLIYRQLTDDQGSEYGMAYGQANQWGMEWIAKTAQEEGIACDLDRRSMLVYAETQEEVEQARNELDQAAAFGLPVSWTDSVDLPFPTLGALKYDNQVQFHPAKFVRGLADRIIAKGGMIFEHTKALELSDGEPCTVRTAAGVVTAKSIVVASHYPIYDGSLYIARLFPYRDYVVAAKIRGEMPRDMSIGVGENSKSFRTQSSPEGELLVVGGEMHKVGDEPDTRVRYERLEAYVRQHFDVASIPYRWSTQDNMTPDSMPYIGEIGPFTKHTYVMTGFSAWGMATGAYGSKIVADLIQGTESPWSKIFHPNRFKGWESLKETVKENFGAVKHLIGDKLTDTEDRTINDLQPGEAAILKVDGEKVAAYREPSGVLHAVSPICTHIGCDVAWNTAEGSWDCPCHGSRFRPDGKVIQGPAVKDLETKPVIEN